jgi:hypothetical protein
MRKTKWSRGKTIGIPLEYISMKKGWTGLVEMMIREARIKPVETAYLVCYWYEESKRRDPDNIRVGEKFIWDGLVAAGVIKNDGWKQHGGSFPVYKSVKEDYPIHPVGVEVMLTGDRNEWIKHIAEEVLSDEMGNIH